MSGSLFEDFVVIKRMEIQNRADLDKNGVEYLVDLISEDISLFQRAFDPEEKISNEELPAKLYEETKNLLEKLAKEYVKVIGVPFSIPPAMELGYNRRCDILSLTEKGFNVINGYRDALGYCSLEEQLKRNSQLFIKSFKLDEKLAMQ